MKMKQRSKKAAAWGLTAAMCLSLLFTYGQPAVVRSAETDSDEMAVTLSNPVIAAEDGKVTWDCVWFGNYWQQEYIPQTGEPEQGEADKECEDADGTKYIVRENAKCYKYEPIKWRVLSISADGRSAFLLADQCLEARPYHAEYNEEVTWETCALREWLNETFMQKAFTEGEQEAIVKKDIENLYYDGGAEMSAEDGVSTEDSIYLPSLDEMLNRQYGFVNNYNDSDYNIRFSETETRIANSSDFAKSCEDGEMSEGYLLRTLGVIEGYVLCTNDGAIPVTSLFGTQVHDTGRGIRPVLHLDLSKTDAWSYAGQVKQDKTEIAPDEAPAEPTQTPVAQPNVTMAPGQVYPKNPVIYEDDLNKNTWDCIYFGRYYNTKFTPSVLAEAEQHDTMQMDENGEYLVRHEEGYFRYEPIKWRVLSIDGTDAFLMADQVIDVAQYYHRGDVEITWEKSDLRAWLNDSFIKTAFNESEIFLIKETTVTTADNKWSGADGGNDTVDKIYLPSIEEMMETSYGFSGDEKEGDTRRISVTDYAKAEEQLDWVGSDSGTYWLRSAGLKKGYPAAVGAWGDGEIQTELSVMSNDSSGKLGVRPVIHVDLWDTSFWTYAGQVTPKGVVVPKEPANTPGPTGLPEDTGEQVTYDAAEFEVFAGRTKEEVGRRYGEAMYAGETYINGDSSTYYETAYSLENPYAAGRLTEDTHKTMTAMTEFYRWLVGVKPLQAVSEHSDKLQAEALVRNFEFNHTVSDFSKPEDMTQEFWDYGAKDYLHTILARYSTPQNAITSWMNEGYSHSYGWDTVGHRYALIGAAVSDVQYGYAGSIAIGQEKAYENTMENPFSAYPAPGYMPTNLVHSSSSAWSIQLNRNIVSVADRSSVVVKVTNTDTTESYECTTANGKLQASEYSSQLVFVQPVPVSGKRYEGSYRVDVTGLTDIETGGDAAITYTTDFFDPTEYTPSYVKTVTADGIEKYIIYTSTATTENLKKIAYALPDEVTVIAENGRTAQVPVTGNWILNEEEQCWVNEADETKLPSDITDRENVLKKCAIYYEISESMYDSYNSLTIYPRAVKAGEGTQMRVFLSLISADTSAIFQLVPRGDGTYTGMKKYDSRTSTGFEVTDNGDHLYKVSSLQKSDEGEYFSIFYESSDTCAYVSTQIQTLTVQDGTQSGDDTPSPEPSVTPGPTPGGDGTPSPEPSATPEPTPGGDGTPSPGPSVTSRPSVTPGPTPANNEGGTGAGDDTKITVPKVDKVKQFKAKAQKKGLVLAWKKNSKVSGYQIQVSSRKNFKGAKKISVKKNKTGYKITKLKSGEIYYVRIRACQSYKTQDGKNIRIYGKWIVKRIETLK